MAAKAVNATRRIDELPSVVAWGHGPLIQGREFLSA